MTIQEWLDINVKPNVVKIGDIKEAGAENGAKTYDVGVYVTANASGLVNRVTQPVYEFDGEFSFGRVVVKNYEVPESVISKEADLLSKFQEIETEIGEEIIIDTTHLKELGIQFLVFVDPRDDVKKVTTTLNGIRLTRKAI
jgi:hypothetical protein